MGLVHPWHQAHTHVMDNTDLILTLGLGLVAVALAVVIPPTPGRPVWLPMVLGILAAALGALAALTVIAR